MSKSKSNKSTQSKVNPQSLCKLLNDIYVYMDVPKSTAIKMLSDCANTDRNNSDMTIYTFDRIMNDESEIKYVHLEMFANFLGVPVGLLLLYSRLRANAANDTVTDSIGIIHGLRVISKRHAFGRELDIQNLLFWSETVKHARLKAEEKQANLRTKNPSKLSGAEADLFDDYFEAGSGVTD